MKRAPKPGTPMVTIFDIPWGGDCVTPVEVLRFRGRKADINFGKVTQAGWVPDVMSEDSRASVNSDALTNRRQIKLA